MLKRIGDYLFWASVYSPENKEKHTASISSDCDTGEYQLCINLGTKDKRKAPKAAEKILRTLARKGTTPMDTHWRTRFERFVIRVQDLAEAAIDEDLSQVPESPISTSSELFISNNWDICDNEAKAKELWPDRYQRYVRADT